MHTLAAALPRPPAFGTLLRQMRMAHRHSQLQLAVHAGVSQRHVSFLESGRAQPSREMVLQLARALDLPLTEHNRWLSAAGYAPAFAARALDARDMLPVQAALSTLLDHHPWPAIVVDRAWNLLQYNRAWAQLLGVLGDADALWQRVCPDAPRNVLLLTLHPHGFAPFITNFAEIASALLARTAREALTHAGVRAVLDTALSYPNLPRPPKADAQLGALPFLATELALGPQRLRLFTVLSTFGTPTDITTDELRVETFFPADDDSATLLRALLRP